MTKDAWKEEAERYSAQYISVCNCGGTGYLRLGVPVGHTLFGKAVPCVCLRDRSARERALRLRRKSGISDTELASWTFENFRPMLCRAEREAARPGVVEDMRGVRATCEQYARDPRGWLILEGAVGCGKTHLAYAVAGACLGRGLPVFAHTVPALLNLLRSGYESGQYEQWFTELKNVALLVLDDLGAQRDTDWAAEQLYELVNHRYAHRLPLVVTTNLDLERAPMDERLRSRLLEGARVAGGWTRRVTLPAADFRPWRREGGVA